MTVRLNSEIREAPTPIYCSSCFNQQPGLPHIDFGAACDRGYGDAASSTPINMDDLIVCANCIKEAAAILNMVPKDDPTINTLKAELKAEESARRKAERWAKTMEDALAGRPEPVEIDYRKRPKGWEAEKVEEASVA